MPVVSTSGMRESVSVAMSLRISSMNSTIVSKEEVRVVLAIRGAAKPHEDIYDLHDLPVQPCCV